jgi:hypothetical protein
MFEKRSDRGYRPALDGIERKTLVHGDKTLMTEFRMRKGAILPQIPIRTSKPATWLRAAFGF